MKINHIYQGDCLEILKTFPSECIDMVITSPPYWGLRDYGVKGQLGREDTLEEYLEKLCEIFAEVKRVLKEEGSCWANLGDAYGGTRDKQNYKDPKYKNGRNGQSISLSKKYTGKCLLQIPSRFALMMTDELGFILRNEIIWHKPNAMPESVKDRFTVDFEKLFFFVKNKKYYFEQQKEAMVTEDINPPRGSKGVIGQVNSGRRKQDLVGRNDYIGFNDRYKPPVDLMRNKRSVWSISTRNYSGLHFAVYPEELIETPIKAGCPKDGIVLDPFMGSGTTGVVAKKLGRNWIGIEINPEYVSIAQKRIENTHYQFYLDFS
jgi:DNA modification methylase